MFAVSKTDAYGSQSLDEQFLGSEHLNGRWCSKIFVWKYENKTTERHYLWMSFHKTLEIFNGGSGFRWNSASMTWERFWPKWVDAKKFSFHKSWQNETNPEDERKNYSPRSIYQLCWEENRQQDQVNHSPQYIMKWSLFGELWLYDKIQHLWEPLRSHRICELEEGTLIDLHLACTLIQKWCFFVFLCNIHPPNTTYTHLSCSCTKCWLTCLKRVEQYFPSSHRSL